MAKKVCFIIFLALFSISFFVKQQKNAKFASWIERTCKPFDKGKLTALPPFCFCQYNLLNVSYNMLKYKELPEVNSSRWLSLENFEGEIWVRMKEYNGNYSISNYGRVKSNERTRVVNRNGGIATIKERILKLCVNKTHSGYLYASFHLKNGESSQKEHVHKLVAKYFIPNPTNFPCINHKDENTRNNCVENLEWCTYAYNNSYGTAIERAKKTRNRKGISKRVGVFDKDMNLVKEYNSLYALGKEFGVHRATISDYCYSGRLFRGFFLKFLSYGTNANK